jgi:methyltransferase
MGMEALGPAQIAALLVLAQRGLEELHSQRNTRRLLAEGGVEAGRDYYPVVATIHLAWIAAVFFLIPPSAEIVWPLLAAYLVLQVARYWVIGTLGRYWTHRIITLPQAPIVKAGPYGLVRHPNYAVVLLETLLLPWVFGAFWLGVIMAAINGAMLYYKIVLEDAALAGRRAP